MADGLALAQRVLVGGVNSPVRAYRHVGGEPVLLAKAKGAEVTDTAGRLYLDFIMGWGALPFGHNPPDVVRAVRRQAADGLLMGLTHPAEVRLARLIVEAVPSVEQVRFTTSGTEACMTAVKLARAITGRPTVLVFEGGYHGHSDSLMAGQSAGIPPAIAGETIRVASNDPAAAEQTIERYAAELACVIIEPVAANMGLISPRPGYLQRLRELTRHHHVLLIFDEVVTGFRLGLGGAQGAFGVTPDLTTFGKIIGGGLPIGAVGGPARFMQRLAPEGDVFHGGTFAGHPLAMAAGCAALARLMRQPPYAQLARAGARLADGLRRAAQEAGVPVIVNQVGSMLTVFFSSAPVEQMAAASLSRRDRFARWANVLRERGVLVPPSPFEVLFVSTAHTEAHLARCVSVARAAFEAAGAVA